MYSQIPDEMRQLPQWIVWKYEATNGEKPTKVPYDPKTGYLANVQEPRTWADYETAVNAASRYSGIGFVLTEHDPYTFIDLDDPEGDVDVLQRQLYVFEQFQSYAELSPSGKGLHIIVKGHVPSGRRRSKIELYSNQRYMTMTGNVYRNMPIYEQQPLLNILWHEMGGTVNQPLYDGNEPEMEDDQSVINRALSAVNGEKFGVLLQGAWQDLYPSQSEADFAFIDILAFYTKNRNQIMRIFRNSALGQRTKAQRNDYVDHMISRSFDRMVPPINLEDLQNKMLEELEKLRADNSQSEPSAPNQPGDAKPNPADSNANIGAFSNAVKSPPPSLLLDIAAFIYRASPRPVPEVSVAAAIGLLAGICGRAYNVSGTGLNQYVMLIASTGAGKEAMASGIGKINKAIEPKVPAFTKFIGPSEIASGQGLVRYIANDSQCFVSVIGEFGLLLKALASPYANQAQTMLKRALLDLYAKSGNTDSLRPTVYSDRMKNIPVINAPAVTILGEAEPEGFYSALDESLVASGLLPRILGIEYDGYRPPANPNHLNEQVPEDIVARLSQLAVYCHELMQKNYSINVWPDQMAAEVFERFDKYCDAKINSADRDVFRQLWNRAHLKAMKLAALIAVGNNPTHPVIDSASAEWAIGVVTENTNRLLAKFEKGEVGEETSEVRQLNHIREILLNYVQTDWSKLSKQRTSLVFHNDKVIPLAYIQQKTSNMSAFKRDKMGATRAMERALKMLIETGVIVEIPQSEMIARYGKRQKAYTIADVNGLV